MKTLEHLLTTKLFVGYFCGPEANYEETHPAVTYDFLFRQMETEDSNKPDKYANSYILSDDQPK